MNNTLGTTDLTVLMDGITEPNFRRKTERDNLKKILKRAMKECSSTTPTYPGKYSKQINDVSEKAMQRAIFANRTTKIEGGKSIQWADIELPILLSDKGRKMCVDLIGILDGQPHICELKYCKPSAQSASSNSPMYGIFETLIYYLIVISCDAKTLDQYSHRKENISFDWRNISRKLIIAANNTYWDLWFQQYSKGKLKQALFTSIKDLNKTYDVDICLFSMPDELFIANGGSYIPKLSNCEAWSRINT